ncbi:hypothetical protein IQ16_07834 [Bradyrhizobium huanghuaihaiense]|uniref:Uncharacterized protein n=1 Tax=Bradyrhizobium huanghuaihaiense TaxID=990078 RepID=A0A562QTN3_9BRAD|nr:hypothetical protein IQ16_07834 [Bradyrhizobium huanghuaihaiense]
MTLAEWCVFGALLLYLSTIASIKWIRFRRFDNSRPRDPAFYEDAIAQRALGAHQNGIETSRSSPSRCCSPNSGTRRSG